MIRGILIAMAVIAVGCQSDPKTSDSSSATGSQTCCVYCETGKPCGNSCISKDKTCNKGVGCACAK